MTPRIFTRADQLARLTRIVCLIGDLKGLHWSGDQECVIVCLVLLDECLAQERTRLEELGVGEAVVDGLAFLARRYDVLTLEDGQMLGEVVDRDAELGSKVADTLLANSQSMDDPQPMLVGEGPAELGVDPEDRTPLRGRRILRSP